MSEKHYLKEGIYLTNFVTFGSDEIIYVDENRGTRNTIVDSSGNIHNFPGIVKEDFWIKEVFPRYLEPKIRFRTSFEIREDKWIVLWEIQPDGRYWGDEGGFGMEHDEEVKLYTYLDINGNFTGPFRIYRTGIKEYFTKENNH